MEIIHVALLLKTFLVAFHSYRRKLPSLPQGSVFFVIQLLLLTASPLHSLNNSHTASFQSFKHAKVLLYESFYFPCPPSQITSARGLTCLKLCFKNMQQMLMPPEFLTTLLLPPQFLTNQVLFLLRGNSLASVMMQAFKYRRNGFG